MWTSLVFLLYALFASVFVVGKWGLEYTQPLFLVGSRMLLAGLLILGYLYFFQRDKFFFKKEHLLKFAFLGIFNIYLTNAFEFWGLQYMTSSKTCFIYSLSPFIAALFSFFIFSEKLSWKKWMGLLLGFIGFIPVFIDQSGREIETGTLFIFSLAELAMMGAVVCSVYGWILLKQLCDEHQYAPFTPNGWSMLLGGIFALTHSYFSEDWSPLPVKEYGPFFITTILLIIISNMICYNLYGWLLKRYSATFMSFAGFSTPLFTAFFGWIFLSETLSTSFILSFPIVVGGLILFHQEEKKDKYSETSFATNETTIPLVAKQLPR